MIGCSAIKHYANRFSPVHSLFIFAVPSLRVKRIHRWMEAPAEEQSRLGQSAGKCLPSS